MKRALALVASIGLCAFLSACEQKGGPLKVESVEPPQGTTGGGEEITIIGAGFESGKTQATVRFGRKLAESVIVASPSKIKVVSPANEKGPVDVKVEFDNGSAFVIPNAFRYVEPATGDNTRRAFFKGDKAAPGSKIEIEKK